jgi:diguanylate cyclase (GGDEF)-like protein
MMSPETIDDVIGKDQLTGLYAAGYLEQRLREEVHRAVRYEQPFSLVMLDLDDFTELNDTFGRTVGNELLLKIAYVLKQSVRESDVLVRYGGDEFAAILMNAHREEAEVWIRRLRESYAASVEGAAHYSLAGFSAGLCVCPKEAITPYTVMQLAETSMYEERTLRSKARPQ